MAAPPLSRARARLRGRDGFTLVEALAALARERGCYGMWVSTELGNEAARRTYEAAGARSTPPAIVLDWEF